MSTRIELLKSRDFGEIITDTFVFARQNLKPLITCFFIFCGFFTLASIFASAVQQSKMVNEVNNTFDSANLKNPLFPRTDPFSFFGIEYLVSILFLFLNYIAISVTVLSFMCLYREKGNNAPTLTEVWGYIKYFFLKILGSSVLLFLLLTIATALCIVPGIYLYPIFGLIFPIMIFENTSFGYAFNKSFKLIKDNWWLTFGCIVVMGIIVYFALMIVVLPSTILNMSNLFLHPGKGMHLSTTLTMITTVLQHLCQVLYILPLITISLCYFNLSEVREGTGLMGRISQIGNVKPEDNFPAEEY
ncbi:MAG TPA: hypothetical protein VGI43_08640 [Mucilaginibacter sp.]|jgi:hypothetical protein